MDTAKFDKASSENKSGSSTSGKGSHDKADLQRKSVQLAAELFDLAKQLARQCEVDARELSDEYVQIGIGYVQRRPLRAMLIGMSMGAVLTMLLLRRAGNDQ